MMVSNFVIRNSQVAGGYSLISDVILMAVSTLDEWGMRTWVLIQSPHHIVGIFP